jgi:hypothetical protein
MAAALHRLVNGVVLLSKLTRLVRPREVEDGDGDEAERVNAKHGTLGITYLLDVSAIPAKALYQAKKAARRPQ